MPDGVIGLDPSILPYPLGLRVVRKIGGVTGPVTISAFSSDRGDITRIPKDADMTDTHDAAKLVADISV